MTKKRYSRQQMKKLFDKECYFCAEDHYELLDAHRIVEGKDGGTYCDWNILTICSKCHRKIHAGIIKILGKYHSTGAKLYRIHYVENGEEKWL